VTERPPERPFAEPGASERDARVRFLVRLARGLHMFGTPAHRIELALETASQRLGIPSQFFALPTVILASFGAPDERSTGLIRVFPGTSDLGRLVDLDRVMRDLLRGEISAEEGSRRIDAIEAAPPSFARHLTWLAMAVIAGCAAVFFGGGWREIGAAAAIGAVPGLLEPLAQVRSGFARIHAALSAFLVSLLALVASQAAGGLSTYVVTVSGLIVLLPGLAITLAILELAAQSLVSGTVRLVSAMVVFLELGFGVALGRIVGGLLVDGRDLDPVAVPDPVTAGALLLAPLAYVVLFAAKRRDALPILLAGALGYLGARAGFAWIGPDLAGFVGAFAVGAASNLWARVAGRPVAVTLLPGILLLVPGSVGFRGLMSLLNASTLAVGGPLRDGFVSSGIETAFRMGLIAASIVAGLLFANVAFPSRRTF
jgi:uncharacterized membrane protein YjjP (DUF1212 family)